MAVCDLFAALNGGHRLIPAPVPQSACFGVGGEGSERVCQGRRQDCGSSRVTLCHNLQSFCDAKLLQTMHHFLFRAAATAPLSSFGGVKSHTSKF